ncbi:DNA topoisomerase IB [Pedobacter boryungensis]|uniref:DNA topoisomerase n=1 Tax=Pedobacter boryungensis TaxID=869962 RepID=A0ABX2DGF5_9SPHI|nr:DNA topoisomerase IB [Pedobacter boryungensis]NQX33015.1 DNA topoisomerase IB [Pedobacter boryungensis]
MVPTSEVIDSSSLVYVHPAQPGIYRKGKPGHFYYVNKKGERIKNEADLERIKKLVLPPAWTDVWISPKKNGYLQAIGIDAAGRKQYRYHTDWTSRRSDHKYFRLLEFGKALTNARKHIAKDLRRKNFDERKVLAICLQVMQKTLIRIGNESYKKAYGSYGLSTLKDNHFKENGSKSTLSFVGKKGVKQEVQLNDKSLAQLVKKCKDIPGQELFQFYTTGKAHKSVDSGMINNYIREITGSDFTAKDFRTWGGTLEALRQLASCTVKTPDLPKKKAIVEVLDCVASKLGNTRAVCKSSYVYPLLLETFENEGLQKYLKKINTVKPDSPTAMANDEKVLMQFLKQAKASAKK